MNKLTKKQRRKLFDAILSRAMGLDQKEVTEEFCIDENGEEKLCKKKITTKTAPPDLTAAKLLLGEFTEETKDLASYTEEELLIEKKKLLQQLSIFDP